MQEVVTLLVPKEVLDAYKAGCTKETLRRQKVDISLFEKFMVSIGVQAIDMFNDLTKWENMTSDALEKFKEQLFKQGYALGSIKVRIATLKAYSRLAAYVNVISVDELRRIDRVRGFYDQEHRFADKKRETRRIGIKKEKATHISAEQAEQLKMQSGSKLQDQRDRVLMCLLIDHGLRISELSSLGVGAINKEERTLTIHKVRHGKQKEVIQTLSKDTFQALEVYIQNVSPKVLLLCSFHRNDKKVREGMTGRAINERVRVLGEKVKLIGLAPEDCRHYWETTARSKS